MKSNIENKSFKSKRKQDVKWDSSSKKKRQTSAEENPKTAIQDISEENTLFEMAFSIASSSKKEKTTQVEDIKKKLAKGEYKIPAKKVAKAFLKEEKQLFKALKKTDSK